MGLLTQALRTIVPTKKAPAIPGSSYGGSGAANWIFTPGGLNDERAYGDLVGDGSSSSIVSACVNWIMRTFPEAPPALWEVNELGVRTRIPGHPMVKLMRRPNPYFSGSLLWMATLSSWVIDGNAYWLKFRNGAGQVVQLWYCPHWMLEPRWPSDGSKYISHYDYSTPGGGLVTQVKPEDVVHFRHGLAPDNIRKGYSPLHGVLREVYTDEQASRFSASMLKNRGIPGVILSPGTGGTVLPEDAEALKINFMQKFNGDRVGEPMVMSGPMTISTFGFSPKDMDLGAMRDIPEERITAALGIPAAVVGFGTGLAQTKVGATMSELRTSAWQSNLIPTMRLLAEEVSVQLLPDFERSESRRDGLLFGFDLSNVAIALDDELKKAQKWAEMLKSGGVRRDEFRSAQDMPSDDEDKVYMVPAGVTLTGPGAPEPPPAPEALPAPDPLLALLPGDGGDGDSPKLTRREIEVAERVVKGMTNRAISEELVISERTVDRHVGSVMAKLGVHSRTQIKLDGARVAKATSDDGLEARFAELREMVSGQGEQGLASILKSMQEASAGRDAALIAGIMELAKAVAAPKTGQLIEIGRDVQRDEKGRAVRIVPVYGQVEAAGG